MTRLDLDIGGRVHAVQCAEQDVAHVTALARRIDGFAEQARQLVGSSTENRIWLYTALLMADQLAEAEACTASPEVGRTDEPRLGAIAARVEAIADALEKVAGAA